MAGARTCHLPPKATSEQQQELTTVAICFVSTRTYSVWIALVFAAFLLDRTMCGSKEGDNVYCACWHDPSTAVSKSLDITEASFLSTVGWFTSM